MEWPFQEVDVTKNLGKPCSVRISFRPALKGRLRQYEAQARLEARGEGERRLQTALAAGRLGAWELELSSMALSASATCKAIFG
ncbi:hypothetical protein ACC725_38095, partial [Rhizobium ruizarguesonis]